MNNASWLPIFCLLPWCLGALIFLGAGALLIWLYRRSQQPKSKAEWATARRKNQAEVEALMPRVQPWRREALADLHTFRALRWGVFGRHARARGLIAADKNDEQRTWAAFALRGRRVYRRPVSFVGQAHARTSAQVFDFETDSTNQVSIQVDGRPLGSLQPDGTLLDTAGEPIGRLTPAADGQSAFPVTLHGRVVAQLAGGRGFRLHKSQARPPAVEIIAPDVTPDERDWLLALALWQIINLASLQIQNDGLVGP